MALNCSVYGNVIYQLWPMFIKYPKHKVASPMLAAKLDCYLGATSSSKEKTEKDFTLSLRMVLLFLYTYMPFSCYPQENVVGSLSETFIEQESPNSMHNICTNAQPCPLLANLEPLPETNTICHFPAIPTSLESSS